MNTKWIVAGLGVLAAVVIGSAAMSTPKISNAQQTQTASVGAAKTYTLADVTTHNSASSCWTAINGKVYDVTSWIGQHPGGPDRILGLCGTDGSTAFNGQHSGQARPAAELASFYIGGLAK